MTDGPAKSGRALLARLIDEVGLWGQCEDFPRRDWVYEASNNDTQVGYWEWVIAKHDLEVEADALAPGVPAVDTSSQRAVTEAVVRQVVNGVADDVLEAAGEPETGVRDAINLVVNGALHRLFDNRDADLAEIVTANYSDEVTVSEVVEWING